MGLGSNMPEYVQEMFKTAFTTFDKDGDGNIDLAEFKYALAHLQELQAS